MRDYDREAAELKAKLAAEGVTEDSLYPKSKAECEGCSYCYSPFVQGYPTLGWWYRMCLYKGEPTCKSKESSKSCVTTE